MNRIACTLCLFFFACTAAPVVEPTHTSIQANVYDVSCNASSCHGADPGEGNLNLQTETSYSAIVNVAPDDADAQGDGFLLVDPGNPDNSFLYVTLMAETTPAYANSMPKGSVLLDAETVDAIRQWIADGALDN